MLLLASGTFLSVSEFSPIFATPDDSTTVLLGPVEEGLNGEGPDELPTRSQGLGGGVLPIYFIKPKEKIKLGPTSKSIQLTILILNFSEFSEIYMPFEDFLFSLQFDKYCC